MTKYYSRTFVVTINSKLVVEPEHVAYTLVTNMIPKPRSVFVEESDSKK